MNRFSKLPFIGTTEEKMAYVENMVQDAREKLTLSGIDLTDEVSKKQLDFINSKASTNHKAFLWFADVNGHILYGLDLSTNQIEVVDVNRPEMN